MAISRRALLMSGGAVGLATLGGTYALVQRDVLPGRIRLHQALASLPVVGDDPPEVPGESPAPLSLVPSSPRPAGPRWDGPLPTRRPSTPQPTSR